MSQQCSLYEVGRLCTSHCSTCGTLCEAFPITDLKSAELYSSQGCTVIVGDLYMLSIPASISESALFEHLKTVTTIRGCLFFNDNLYLSAMTFLSNIVSLNGAVYRNNPQLIDARLSSLHRLNGNVTVEGCDRLCPARYTAVGMAVDEAGCVNPELRYFLHIEGPAAKSEIGVVGTIMQNVLRNVTNGGVCRVTCSCLSPVGLRCFCLVEWNVEREGD